MTVAIQISPNRSFYIRDPQATTTGRNLLKYSIPLMLELGFEKFTFRKLAERMGASEITVYRYFENKHKLLLYLLGWYWEWVKYSILFNTQNVDDGGDKLRIAIRTVVESRHRNRLVDYIEEEMLFELVIEESGKAYHTKFVDQENKEGFFLTLKSLKTEISGFILEVKPGYRFASSLASTILEMSASLRFFALHLPSMADVTDPEKIDDQIGDYLETLTFSALSD